MFACSNVTEFVPIWHCFHIWHQACTTCSKGFKGLAQRSKDALRFEPQHWILHPPGAALSGPFVSDWLLALQFGSLFVHDYMHTESCL